MYNLAKRKKLKKWMRGVGRHILLRYDSQWMSMWG